MASPTKRSARENVHNEFFGPYGTALCTVLVPHFVFAVALASTTGGSLSVFPWSWPPYPAEAPLFSWQGLGVVYAWFAAFLLLHKLVPARSRDGVMEADGTRWRYRLNGRLLFVLVYFNIAVLTFGLEWVDLSWAAVHILELLSGATVLAISLAVTLYIASFRRGVLLAESASASFWYGFWMGRELNPRIFGVDLKEFCELYPGLTAWAILNLAFLHRQLLETGSVSPGMVFVNIAQLLYIADAVWNEPSILTTMDITTEGFGFMLSYGDFAWVPFIFSTQAKFIADGGGELPLPGILAAAAICGLGYYIFRGANAQKDQFRRDPYHPSVVHLRTITTSRGTQLICSGWWGYARHINYTGDWLIGLSWCIACGFRSAVPYVYALSFAALLAHRERRDDRACRRKYGFDWDRYCKLVPWRLIPRVY